MEASNFYMTLPSNASIDLYPKNSLSDYKVQLPRTLNLNHKYETALVEITYPATYDLLSQTLVDIVIGNTETGVTHQTKLEGLTLTSVRKVISKTNSTLATVSEELKVDKVRLQLIPENEKLRIHMGENML